MTSLDPTRRTTGGLSILLLVQVSLTLLPSLAPGVGFGAETSGDLRKYCEANQGNYFYGLYLVSQKVGWMSIHMQLGEHEDREAYLMEMGTQIRFSVFGIEQNLEMKGKTAYLLTGDGSIAYTDEKTTENGEASQNQAVARDEGFLVDLELEGRKRQVRTTPSKDNVVAMQQMQQWMDDDRQPGDTLKSYSFDFDHIAEEASDGAERIEPDSEETIVFVSRRKGRWSGVPVVITRVKIKTDQFTADTELLPDGTPRKFSMGPIEARLEEEEVAKNLKLIVADMLFRVPADRDIGTSTLR